MARDSNGTQERGSIAKDHSDMTDIECKITNVLRTIPNLSRSVTALSLLCQNWWRFLLCFVLQQMTAVKPTPRQVAQLYKAVLRYATAAVLYARPAKPNLRALYRPEFDIWMAAAKEPGSVKPEAWLEFARRSQSAISRSFKCAQC